MAVSLRTRGCALLLAAAALAGCANGSADPSDNDDGLSELGTITDCVVLERMAADEVEVILKLEEPDQLDDDDVVAINEARDRFNRIVARRDQVC